LKITIIPGNEEAINLFKIREINLSLLKDMDRNTLLNDKEARVVSFLANEVEVLGFNYNHEALKDRRVRQAIAYAINKESIIETCYYNSGVINDTIYYPNYLGIASDAPIFAEDIKLAKSLLLESGFQGLSLSLLVNGEDHARNLAAQMVKDSLGKIGISVSLVPLNREDYIAAMANGEFDLYLGGFQIKDTYDVRPLLHSAYNNPIGYTDIRIDNLLDQMQSSISSEEKRKVFGKIHDILVVDIPYLPLLYKTYGMATPIGLEGKVEPLFHNIYHGAENWKLTYVISEKSQITP
jgi:peptide/nickel transport system substrate-binding protein